MKLWFTSDLHFGHQNIINLCRRPFHSVDNMNKLLVENYNEVVSMNDIVYIVGDFAMGKIADTLEIANELNGYKVLVAGNHDRMFKEKGRVKWHHKYLDAGFNDVLYGQQKVLLSDDTWIDVCHFPYSGDSQEEDRYLDSRPQRRGNWLLHGHIHGKNRLSGEKQIDVGVDANGYYPVSEKEILDIIKGG